ncbi:hypothetical protein K435DRAFT_812277 [Dendrothele bispora CBS 962.96]|uniref:Uncharacterized protein n=1 Tax=Dendrothele bispora (strain CBS 962.96) TaxID=1314807 RepID=A0A4S8KPJ5_DENBC|nr:hypothetical protein K435DRAFT_812277 [Dendrothele bispora CBS 962.96]
MSHVMLKFPRFNFASDPVAYVRTCSDAFMPIIDFMNSGPDQKFSPKDFTSSPEMFGPNRSPGPNLVNTSQDFDAVAAYPVPRKLVFPFLYRTWGNMECPDSYPTGYLESGFTLFRFTTKRKAIIEHYMNCPCTTKPELKEVSLLKFATDWEWFCGYHTRNATPYVVNAWPAYSPDKSTPDVYENYCYARLLLFHHPFLKLEELLQILTPGPTHILRISGAANLGTVPSHSTRFSLHIRSRWRALTLASEMFSRSQNIFSLSALALLIGITENLLLAILNTILVYSPNINGLTVTAAINTTALYTPIVVESMLLLRLRVVLPFKSSPILSLWMLICPIAVVLARLFNMAIAVDRIINHSVDIVKVWHDLPFAKIEWFLQLSFNLYSSGLFLWILWRNGALTASEAEQQFILQTHLKRASQAKSSDINQWFLECSYATVINNFVVICGVMFVQQSPVLSGLQIYGRAVKVQMLKVQSRITQAFQGTTYDVMDSQVDITLLPFLTKPILGMAVS